MKTKHRFGWMGEETMNQIRKRMQVRSSMMRYGMTGEFGYFKDGQAMSLKDRVKAPL